MSEEEIIKYIKDEIEDDIDTREWFDDKNNATRKDIEKGIEAHQGLLDLYNKEKENNIYLTQELETRKWVKVKENGEVEPAFYISKDKIREKVIEIKNKKVKDVFITTAQGKLDTIIALESLLEEE